MIIFSTLIISLKYNPSLLWATILGSATVSFAIIAIAPEIWAGSLGILFGLIISLFFFSFIAIPVGGMIGVVPHITTLAIYLIGTMRIRRAEQNFKPFFNGAWLNCGFKSVFRETLGMLNSLGAWIGSMLKSILGWLLGLGILGALCTLLVVGIIWLFDVFQPLAIILLVSITVVIIIFVYKLIKENFASLLSILGSIIAIFLFQRVLRFWDGPFKTIGSYTTGIGSYMKGIGSYIAQSLLIAIILGLVLLIAYIFRLFFRQFAGPMLWKLRGIQPDTFTSSEWEDRIAEANADKQNELLIKTTHQTLGLKAEEFFKVLKDIGPVIKSEPALSTYWDMRDQLEQVLKQERQG